MSTSSDDVGGAGRTLGLGQALVDLICERPIDGLARAGAVVPHFGGAVANVAVMAARSGARVALAGGACGDGWGRRLRKRLREEGVDVPGVRVRVISTIGAGDVLTGILLGSFALSGFDPASVAASLPEAVEASARACERWAALE